MAYTLAFMTFLMIFSLTWAVAKYAETEAQWRQHGAMHPRSRPVPACLALVSTAQGGSAQPQTRRAPYIDRSLMR